MPVAGSCKRCGNCCKYASSFHYDIVVNKQTGQVRREFGHVTLPLKENDQCLSLSYDSEGKAVCYWYEARKMVCREFPKFKEELIFKECGYYWVE